MTLTRRHFLATAGGAVAATVLPFRLAGAATHGFFRFVNPPSQEKLQQCLNALDACDYPWARCAAELNAHSGGVVEVVWKELSQGVTGQYLSHANRIELNNRYASTDYTFTMAHEAGHMVDDTALRDDQRQALLAKWHADDDGRYTGDPNTGSSWGHENEHVETWKNSDDQYYLRPNEAFADAFVAAFAPSIFPYKRFAHWSDDIAGVRAIILSEPEPTQPVSKFPNDSIYRLYRAFFLREPDQAGYDYWKAQHESGVSLLRIADWFAASDEFEQRYGTLSNTDYVKQIYRNVLGREADSEGLAHWVDVLNRGYTRGYVMLQFSESQEYITKIDKERA